MLEIQDQIEMQIGKEFIVKNRFEQQEFIYKILNTEKLVVLLILLFTMILAMFNISGSLSAFQTVSLSNFISKEPESFIIKNYSI